MKEAGVFPHTSQAGSAFKGQSTDAGAEEAGADADAAAEKAGADADADADADAAAEEAGANADATLEEAGADAADECAEATAEVEAEAEEEEEDDVASASAAAAVDGNVVSPQTRWWSEGGEACRPEALGGDGLLEAPAFFPPLFFGMLIVCGSDERKDSYKWLAPPLHLLFVLSTGVIRGLRISNRLRVSCFVFVRCWFRYVI